MVDLIKNLSAYISIPLLLVFGLIVFELWKRIEKLKNEQINVGKQINILKDEEIKILERHLNAVKDTHPDPQSLLASVEVIEKATKQQIDNLEKEKQEALKKYSTEKQQREYIEKLYSQANSITDSDSTILRIISHEAATGLFSIRGAANRVKQRSSYFADSPQKLSMYMEDIEHSAYQLMVLFTGIPNILSQDARINLEPTRIYEDILSKLINMVRSITMKNLGLHVEISYKTVNHISPISVDRRATEQAFYNILMNAVQYHDSNKPDITVNIVANRFDDHIEIKFQDYGLGIDENETNRIFMQGYRAPASIRHYVKGSGLGLTVARKAAELHGGTLELTSVSNPTEFTYSIPIRNEA